MTRAEAEHKLNELRALHSALMEGIYATHKEETEENLHRLLCLTAQECSNLIHDYERIINQPLSFMELERISHRIVRGDD